MKKTILLSNRYTGYPLEIVRKTVPDGFELLMLDEVTQDDLEKKIPAADYLLASGRLKISRTVLDRASRLKMIQRTGVGLDSLDLDSIKQRGIPLYVNRGINAESVAEHALLLMLAALRKLPVIDCNTKQGIWKKQEQGTQTHELKGKTVGIIGMGSIAKTLAELLVPFRVKILYFDIIRQSEDYERTHCMTFAGLDELLSESDIVTIHCALTDETRNLFNRDTFAKMKEGAVLINTARGPVVNAGDLAEALRSGRLSFAGIDVHETEPIPDDYPLKKAENVILTPHIGGVTYESFYQMMHDAMRNISMFDKGDDRETAKFRYL